MVEEFLSFIYIVSKSTNIPISVSFDLPIKQPLNSWWLPVEYIFITFANSWFIFSPL